MSKTVLEHLPLITSTIASEGFSNQPNLVPTILSLIHVESLGNASARRTNPNGKLSEFCGLLQIGHAISKDFGATNTDFIGDPELSIKCFLDWCKRYENILNWNQELIFLGWKAGVGTVKEFKKRREEGTSDIILRMWLNRERWSAGVYLDRCYKARERYEKVEVAEVNS